MKRQNSEAGYIERGSSVIKQKLEEVGAVVEIK